MGLILHKKRGRTSMHSAYDLLRLVLLVVALSMVNVGGYAQADEKSSISTETLEDGSLSIVATIVGDAGQLPGLIGNDVAPNVKKLKIIGNVNGDDFLLVRQMCCAKNQDEENQGISHPFIGQLSYLDLTDAAIVYGGSFSLVGGSFSDYYSTYENHIRYNMFCNSILEVIYLPKNITGLDSAAFDDCTYLLEIHFTGIKAPDWLFRGIAVDFYVPGDCMEYYQKKYEEYIDGYYTKVAIYAGPDLGVVNETVHVETAGTLSEKLTDAEKTYKLKVTGKLNAYDMQLLSNMVNQSLAFLDLSEAMLVDNNGQTLDVLDGYMFRWQLNSLDYFVLPNSIKNIEESAMSAITNIDEFVVAADNSNYKYVGDILYTADGKKLVYCDRSISLSTLEIPEGTEEIGPCALENCNVDMIVCPSSLKTIDNSAFRNVRASAVNLNEGLVAMGNSCFVNSSLRSIQIPEGIQAIPEHCFRYCYNLVKIKLPSSVASIAKNAFGNCNQLQAIEIAATDVPTLDSLSFTNTNVDNVALYVATGMADKYKAAALWEDFNVVEGSAPRMGISADELAILKTLYEKTDGANWNSKWAVDWDSDVFSLTNVNTQQKDDGMYHVTSIYMYNNNLVGELPVELFDLPYLTNLSLGTNMLTGDIGTMFKNRTPKAIQLSYISLGANLLTGDIYPFVAALPGLTELSIGGNRLTEISQALPERLSYISANYQFESCPEEAPIIEDMALSEMKLSSFKQPMATYNQYEHAFGTCSSASVQFKQDGSNYYSTLFGIGEDGLWFNSYEVSFKPGDYACLYLWGNGTGSYYRLKLDFDLGDTNLDGTVDMEDLQNTVNKAVGEYVSNIFFSAADSNSDGAVNVMDVVTTANIILDSPVPTGTRATASDVEGGNFIVVGNGRIGLELTDSVSALDMVLTGVEADDITLTLPSSEWQMMKRQTDQGVRVIIFSPTGASFSMGASDLMAVAKEGVRVNPVMAVSPSAKRVTLGTRSSTTGINAVSTEGSLMDIYDLQGRLLKSNVKTTDGLQPGIYILHDKVSDKKQKLNIKK